MSYSSNSPGLRPFAKMLPPAAMDALCDAMNSSEALGLNFEESMRMACAEVNKGWHLPDGELQYVRKDEPGSNGGSGSVHVDTPLGSGGSGRRRRRKPGSDAYEVDDVVTKMLGAEITKVGTDESRMAYGWASVISEAGTPVIDSQGDIISGEELHQAATDFMADARIAKAMHDGDGIGEVLHSMPLTADLAKSLGVESDREGWIVGVKVHDDETWSKVKAGTLKAFSIGGNAVREPAE